MTSTTNRRATTYAALAFLALSLLWASRVWISPQHRSIGYGGDSYHVMWCLGWVAHALSHGMNPFVSAAVRAPAGVNLMWQVAMPALAVLMTPLTLAAGPEVSYNVVATAAPALSGWVAFLALRHWTRPLPAFCGGVLFAFSPFMTVQGSQHAFLTFLPTAPLLMILFDRVLRLNAQARQRLLDAVAIGVVLGCQFLISEELFTVEVVVAAAVLAGVAVRRRRQARRAVAALRRPLLTCAATACTVVAWPLYEQFRGPWRISHQLHASGQFVTDALGFVVPSPPLLVDPSAANTLAWHFTGNWSEWDSYVGLPLILFVAVCARRYWHRQAMRLGVVIAVVPAVLALGATLHVDGTDTHVPMPWVVGAHLPVLEDLLPTRFAGLMFLGLALVVAAALDELPRDQWRHRTTAYATLIVAAVAVTPHWPYAAQRLAVPAAFVQQQMCRTPQPVVAVLPYQNDTLSWQAAADYCYRTPEAVNFNTDGPPPGGTLTIDEAAAGAANGQALPPVTAQLATAVRARLHAREVTAVVLGPGEPGTPSWLDPALSRWLTALLAQRPQVAGGVQTWTLPH